MGTVKIPFDRPSEAFDPIGSAFPQSVRIVGTNFVVEGLAFDASANEACVTKFKATNFGSGNPTLSIQWYAATDTTVGHVVNWGVAIACITPDTDSQDIETKAFATENTQTDTHLGTTGKRLHTCTVTITNLDSLAADDVVWLRIRRLSSSNTLTGDAILVTAELSYSDT